MESFATLGLSAPLLRTIEAQAFTVPTAIQMQAIPPLLAGRDLMGTAQTGEGKTAAYLLPILDRLAAEGAASLPNRPRVLILTPTRELAIQIANVLRDFTKGHKLYYTAVYGGMPFVAQRQVLEKGVHFLVATPGRLMDHISRHSLVLDKVDTLVLDEADRMLDMGFVDAVKEIAAALPKNRQTMMVSATMSRGVRNLAAGLLRDPATVDVGQANGVAALVDHRVMRVKYPDKKPLLLHLLARPEVARVLVFVRTKAMADILVDDIRAAGMKAQAIHGDKEQSERQRVLRGFRMGTVNILIATDVAARGIDVPDISHVINYDMPLETDAYVHRVGRTGRAGMAGVALSICDHNEGNLIRNVERAIGQAIPVDAEQPFHDSRPDVRGGPSFVNNRRPGGGGKPGAYAKSHRGDHRDSRPPQGDRHQGDRPQRDRSQGDRSQGDRPQGDRPQGDRPQGDRPQREKSWAAKPERAPRRESWSPVSGPVERSFDEVPKRGFAEKPKRDFAARPKRDFAEKPKRDFAETANRVDSFNARGGSFQADADAGSHEAPRVERPAYRGKPAAGEKKPFVGNRSATERKVFSKKNKAATEKPIAEKPTYGGDKPAKRPLKPAAFAKRVSRAAFDAAARGERPAPAAVVEQGTLKLARETLSDQPRPMKSRPPRVAAEDRPSRHNPGWAKPAVSRFKKPGVKSKRSRPGEENAHRAAPAVEGRFKSASGKPKRSHPANDDGRAPLKRKKRPSA